MPDPAVLTDLGKAMLEQLPPQLQGSIDYMAVIHAQAREVELLEEAIEQIRAQFNPATADLLLGAWEFEVRLPVGGSPGQSIDQRRAAVIGRLQKPLTGEGRDWERAITAIVGQGWSYQEHDPNDASSPDDGVVRVTVPWASGTPQFENARTQIRAITDAHLLLDMQSSSLFLLDESEMDSQEFGA